MGGFKRKQLLVTLLLVVLLDVCSGELFSTLSQCCNQGSARSELNRSCDGGDTSQPASQGSSSSVPRRVERHLQAICQSTLAICCLRTYRRRMCSAGIQAAKLSPSCVKPDEIGGEYFKDCCDACKLGVAVRSKGGNDELSCKLEAKSFELGSPWHDAFRQCCIDGLNSSSQVLNNTVTMWKNGSQTLLPSIYDPRHPIKPLPSHPSNVSDKMNACDRAPQGELCDHVCVDTPQGYYCHCRPGYRLQADGRSCFLGSDRCSLNDPCDQGCKDTGDAIVCTCRPGYTLKEDGLSCHGNVDECEEESHDCSPETERCMNTLGGYSCASRWPDSSFPATQLPPKLVDGAHPSCALGHEYSPHLYACQDTDECALGTDTCDHVSQFCLNTIGSYVCMTKQPLVPCPPGHRYDETSNLCIDIDECSERLDACNHEREFCLNLMGTYECHPRTGTTCPAGYKFNSVLQNCEDVDECVEELHNCDGESEMCRNVVGAYECDVKCGKGFRYVLDFRVCVDVDECYENLHDCDVKLQEVCVNTQGAYECTSNPSAECKAGYKPEAGGCVDVNECQEDLDACDRATEVCVNDVGLYRCEPKLQSMPTSTTVSCSDGYRFKSGSCVDVNECEEGLHNCHQVNAVCINVIGSFICELTPCHGGFSLNLTTGLCQDVNECADRMSNNCSDSRRCVNTDGGYDCVDHPSTRPCPPGHHYSVSENTCQDIDECELRLDACDRSSEICFNTKGSYRCWQVQCPVGYRANILTKTCEDIDECADQTLNTCSANETCVNQRGRFYCKPAPTSCPPGHHQNLETNSCEDVDECAEVKDVCRANRAGEECVNTAGSYECVARRQPCPPGFRMDTASGSCADVNECLENSHDCDLETSDCRNTHGGFVCQAIRIKKSTSVLPKCAPGFEYGDGGGTRVRCLDVDECSIGADSCDRHRYTCANTVGSFACVPVQLNCPSGYKFNARNRTCEDVDECADGTHSCRDATERCLNQVGGFRCVGGDWRKYRFFGRIDHRSPQHQNLRIAERKTIAKRCSLGLQYSDTLGACVDLNECQIGAHNCLTTQRCDNTVGSFSCIRLTGCGTGYTLNAHTSHCEDDDECMLGFHNCGPAYQCRNTLGSFRCERKICPAGTRLVADGRCISVVCGPGKQLTPSGQCTDVNECETTDSYPCKKNQRCINTVGTYLCQDLINCGEGYEMDQPGSRCVDIDECSTGTHDCHNSQQCINRAGGYVCQCPIGYSLNANNDCEDINECTRYSGKVCGNNAVCRNVPGSYVCDCNEGFQNGENNKTCVDLDECKLLDNVCQHSCVNMWGSYQCGCQPGYTQGADKRTCIDVDECSLYKDRGNLCVGICVNEPGSFSCSCPDGYTLSADKRTCQDVDECQQQLGSVCRGPDETCLNTRGSYRCNTLNCPPTYIRDNSHKNRCKRQSTICHQDDVECIKQPLSYSFNYLTFVSNLPIPSSGHVNLFTMRGPPFADLTSEFNLELRDARAPPGIAQPATRDFFQLRRTSFNQAVVSLVRTIEGPQEIELELSMNLYRGSLLGGTALAKIYIFVTPYEF